MGLRIIYGKPGSGKSQFCFSEIGQYSSYSVESPSDGSIAKRRV